MSARAWESLGRCKPTQLGDARLQLHHAAQLVASVGHTLLEALPDDSQPNLGWLAAEGALAGHRIFGARPFRAALALAGLRLLLLDLEGRATTGLDLAGKTLASGRSWLSREVETRLGRPLPAGLAGPGYEIPPHPVADGAAFGAPGESFAEMARWFAAADAELQDFAHCIAGASEVRCWPHHFDIATLVTVETGADGAATKTVGLGLSPGDGSYPEPYLYVTPWPYPDATAELPALASGGHWHREGFTAAILTGSGLVSGGPAESQPGRLRAFLASAYAAARAVHVL